MGLLLGDVTPRPEAAARGRRGVLLQRREASLSQWTQMDDPGGLGRDEFAQHVILWSEVFSLNAVRRDPTVLGKLGGGGGLLGPTLCTNGHQNGTC